MLCISNNTVLLLNASAQTNSETAKNARLLPTMIDIAKTEGLRKLMAGAPARVMWTTPQVCCAAPKALRAYSPYKHRFLCFPSSKVSWRGLASMHVYIVVVSLHFPFAYPILWPCRRHRLLGCSLCMSEFSDLSPSIRCRSSTNRYAFAIH